MRKFLLLLLIAGVCNVKEPKLDGAYENVRNAYSDSTFPMYDTSLFHNIKIFRNGYWISITFRDLLAFKCYGGTYRIEDGKCIQTCNFNSFDSAAVGKADTLDYNLEGNKLSLEEFAAIDKYKVKHFKDEYLKANSTLALANSSLEGIWKLKNQQMGDTKNFGNMEDGENISEIKMYVYPYVAWAQYNLKRKKFIGAGIAAYQFDGDNLNEKYQFITYPRVLDMEFSITMLSSNELMQVGFQQTFKETWERIK